ncbi:hypothetical protein [Mycobacteroides abscessus]|uniref:hypothetical protein n=1 Tax=Mycobacteroides abscessus TaxID=36809 RepID=UPI000C26197E|nr:hypothetical protein [Mycobacteroides abscessus]
MPIDQSIAAEIDLKFPIDDRAIPTPTAFAADFEDVLAQTIKLTDASGALAANNVADTLQYLSDIVIGMMLRDDMDAETQATFYEIIDGEVEYLFSRDTTLQDSLIVDYSAKYADVHRALLILASLRAGPRRAANGRAGLAAGGGGSPGAITGYVVGAGTILGVGFVSVISGAVSVSTAGAAAAVAVGIAWAVTLFQGDSFWSRVSTTVEPPRDSSIGVSSWNINAAGGERSRALWQADYWKLLLGDSSTTPAIPSSDIAAMQELRSPEQRTDAAALGFQAVAQRTEKDQLGNEWEIWTATYTPPASSNKYQYFKLNTRSGNDSRNLALILHPDFVVDVDGIKIISVVNPDVKPKKDKWRPILGLRFYRRTGPKDRKTVYSYHSEIGRQQDDNDLPEVGNEKWFSRVALTHVKDHTVSSWVVIGDFNWPISTLRGDLGKIKGLDLLGVYGTAPRTTPFMDPNPNGEPTRPNTKVSDDHWYDYVVTSGDLVADPEIITRPMSLGPVVGPASGDTHTVTPTKSDHFAVFAHIRSA